MRLRPRYRHWIPRWLGVSGIVLYPYVLFAPGREEVSIELLQHEMIHVRQVRDTGWLRFYFDYSLQYLRARFQGAGHDEAYRLISYERDACSGQRNLALSELEVAELGISRGATSHA